MNALAQIGAVVIGGSAGAFEVLRKLLPCFQGEAPPVVVLLHLPEDSVGLLHESLGAHAHLPTHQAEEKEFLQRGHIYFGPPGYHLLIETDGSFSLSVDPPVHYSRPSIDVLFESAADAYGPRLLGILLSGASEDGADGLQKIRESGGQTWVQSPVSAEVETMPAAALARFSPDCIASPAEMMRLLGAVPG